jgi:hypothetical protein
VTTGDKVWRRAGHLVKASLSVLVSSGVDKIPSKALMNLVAPRGTMPTRER